MPPLKYFPEAFRSGPADDDYTILQMQVEKAELKRINLGGESIYYVNDSDIEMIAPAYALETARSIYVTDGPEGYHSPDAPPIKKGWLRKILGI